MLKMKLILNKSYWIELLFKKNYWYRIDAVNLIGYPQSPKVTTDQLRTAEVWLILSYGTKTNFYERKTSNGDYYFCSKPWMGLSHYKSNQ